MLSCVTSFIGTFIQRRRVELCISQRGLASALGVSKTIVHRWETGERPLPRERVPPLAQSLCVEGESLLEMLDSSLPRPTSLRIPAPLASLRPIECTVEPMCTATFGGQAMRERVKEKLGEVPYAEMEAMFPRQTPWELYAAHAVLLDSATLAWQSPLVEGCRKPIFGEDGQYEGHLMRLAIVWERDGVRDVFFPQVPTRVVGDRGEELHRLDYLIVHTAPRRPPQTVGLELDGEPHKYQQARDEKREAKLPFPVVRFDNGIVAAPQFLPRLFEHIHDKALWAQASGESFQGFLDDRRQRFERLKTER